MNVQGSYRYTDEVSTPSVQICHMISKNHRRIMTKRSIVDKSAQEPGEWVLKGLFLLNEGRIPDSFALKGSPFDFVLCQTSV